MASWKAAPYIRARSGATRITFKLGYKLQGLTPADDAGLRENILGMRIIRQYLPASLC
jgi:hypothetical protein